MSTSHLRVELRSPKRSLDGGYGFDLTRYCASCWSRLGRILKRGARCGVCGKRVCKGCRHFVAAKEWICSLCYKKRYAPEDSWHDDADIGRFKGNQGKNGTYLLRLTDWSAHGVLNVHTISEFQPGRIHPSYSEPVYSVPSRNKIQRRNTKSKSYYSPVNYVYNYPLTQRDIQLKNWRPLSDAMNPQSHKDNHLKYTSVNLKQKRREIREYRASSSGRGRLLAGNLNEGAKRKGYSYRINPTKREHFEPAKTLYHDYDNPLASSGRRLRSNANSSANSSWQKESRRSRRSCGSFSHPPVLYRDEPHVRLSVRGTRIFGRRKSYRACPTLKGDARLNGTELKCKSTSLPCELSHVESHDYEFWNSGFVQTRVRKLEEELTAKCEDKFSVGHDYEVQSLCSLQLDKIRPGGDDYRIAYLSSTSQDSSLDYMDDNYYTIGMGTLDVRLNKKRVFPGNEDWDLSFSSEEADSSTDDDEFFYRKYTQSNSDSLRNYYSGNTLGTPDVTGDFLQTPEYGKKYQNISENYFLEVPKSIKEQIHENVDKIFYNVMQCDLDNQYPPEENLDKTVSLVFESHSLNSRKEPNVTEASHENRNKFLNLTSNHTFERVCNDFRNIEDEENHAMGSNTKTVHFENQIGLAKQSCSPENVTCITTNNFFIETRPGYDSDNYYKSNFTFPAVDHFSKNYILDEENSIQFEKKDENACKDYIQSFSLTNEIPSNNFQNSILNKEVESKCLFSIIEPNKDDEQKQITQFTKQLCSDKHSVINHEEISNNCLINGDISESLRCELTESQQSEHFETEKITNYEKDKVLRCNTFGTENNDIPIIGMSLSKTRNYSIDSFVISKKNKPWNRKFRNSLSRLKKHENCESSRLGKTDFTSNISSVWEIDLSPSEPLTTPFAEIYFITYGKEYPYKSNCMLSIPRSIPIDIDFETANIVSQNIIEFNQPLVSHIDKLLSKQWNNGKNSVIYNFMLKNANKPNRKRYLIKSCSSQNYDRCFASLTDTAELNKDKNNEFQTSNKTKLNYKDTADAGLNNQFCNIVYDIVFDSQPFMGNNLSLSCKMQNVRSSPFFVQILSDIPKSVMHEMLHDYYSSSYFPFGNEYEENYNASKMSLPLYVDLNFIRDFFRIYIQTLQEVDVSLQVKNFVGYKEPCLKIYEPILNSKPIIDITQFASEDTKIIFKIPHLLSFILTDMFALGNTGKNLLNPKSKIVVTISSFKINYEPAELTNTCIRTKHCNESRLIASLQPVCLHPEIHKKYKLTPRNRNYWFTRKETEIANEVLLEGESSESRFAAESQPLPATSSTGNATFVEYLFPQHLASVRETRKARLQPGSAIQLTLRSVPAVQRSLVDRESWITQLLEDRKHGSLCAAETVILTDREISFASSENTHISEPHFLDFECCENERITYLDRDYADYALLGSVPEGLLRQLICNPVTVGGVDCNNFNPTSVQLSELQQIMATSDEDPRLVNKTVRVPGRNISKLKKFFDTRESVLTNSEVMCSENSEISMSSHSVDTTAETDIKCDQYTNGKSEYESLNEIMSTSNSSKMLQDELLPKSQVKISSSDIPYCRKVSSGGELWKNVDIGVTSTSEGLWTNVQNNDIHSNDSHYNHSDSSQGHNSFVSSTADLHDLIASSRAELSKKKEPEMSDKSTLENYFTSFENTKPKKFVPLSSLEQSGFTDTADFQFSNHDSFRSSSYDCDVEEMNFEEEEATLSDTSSDEEIRCNPPMDNHYIPTYSLHTIIEESCEESSRGATPTNEPSASKLERYFSWDIINETELKRKEDDDSTVYSDSLSDISGSLNDDVGKDIDPSQLASSRLEKYFTSGLVGNENYFYPDDAEFLEDGPVSDFDEDSTHQKISRSALLSSLETLCDHTSNLNEKDVAATEEDSKNDELSDGRLLSESPKNVEKDSEVLQIKTVVNKKTEIVQNTDNCDSILPQTEEVSQNYEISNSGTTDSCSNIMPPDVASDNLKDTNSDIALSEIIENNANIDNSLIQKQTVNKEQLAMDAQAIIKKLLMYFSGSASNSYNSNKESDYKSAWTILETEIERLIQSIPNAASLENNSCNSSTIDSNNSDYGSDTIESLDCMTDEDEATDSKTRSNAKYPLVDLFNATYKPGYDFPNFNISDETLSIWKRLIQSLQKDNFCMNDNKLYDPNTEARLYIRDQIVNLMHTVTVNDNKVNDIIEQNNSKTIESVLDIQDKEIASSLVEESNMSEDINEAYNISIGNAGLLTCLSENDTIVLAPKVESLDEYVLVESSEVFEEPKAVDMYQSCSDSDIEFESKSGKDLKTNILESYGNKDIPPNKHQLSDKNIDEVDLKLDNICSRKIKNNDNRNFSVCVDIELSDAVTIIPEPNIEAETLNVNSATEESIKRSSLHMWVSGENEDENKEIDDDITEIDLSQFSLPPENPSVACVSTTAKIPEKSHRDTGYYSFKSSEDSLLNDTPPPDAFMDVPNFKSLKRSVKKFPLSNTLSKSTNNINQVLSSPDAKFSTLQLKPQKSKRSSNSSGSPSRQFTSLFSPTAVFKKITGSKNVDAQTSESSIPTKYLKKYARSSSVESENILGAISMPQLNIPKSSDSYSALGLYPENDRDSSLMDDDIDVKRYSTYSHSVLSLGAHSASMTSIYSAAGCHYGYVTVSGDVLFGLNYNQKSQMMEVFVKQCRNLAAVDSRRNKSDPYVKVYLLPDKTKSGKRKTKTKKNSCSPVFNELLRFPVLKHELESRTLWLSVWNSDLFGRNDFLGEILLPLGYRLLDSPTLRWYPLQERMESLTSPLNYKGELFLALKYVPRDLSLESRFRPAPVISLRGALHVLVKEARNISGNGSGGNLDAFCKSYLLPDKSKSSKQKTPVVKRSRHPKWYYTMIYEDLSVDELKERSLELTVWDHDKITSNEFMGGVRLNIGSGLYHGVPVDWMDARRDEASLWQSMLESPNMWVDGCLPLRPTMQFHHG